MNDLKAKTVLVNLLQRLPLLIASILLLTAFLSVHSGQTIEQCSSGKLCAPTTIKLDAQCGSVTTSIDFGCSGTGNPITDLLFAVIRFLSAGVGLVIVASMIVGGIQYIISRGEPGGTQAAIKRITSSFVALLMFIFAYAILNYVIPGGLFKP